MVIRDENNMVLALMAKQLPQLYTALEIETMAASTALTFVTQVKIHSGILELDSLVLATTLINNSTYLSTEGLLMEDIRFNASFFNQLLYSHVKREGNKVAHISKTCSLYLKFLGVDEGCSTTHKFCSPRQHCWVFLIKFDVFPLKKKNFYFTK